MPHGGSHPCCTPNGECVMATEDICFALGGEWFPGLLSCADVVCEPTQACRPPLTEIPNDTDLRNTLDHCETAVMQITKRNPEHMVPGQPVDDREGVYGELITSHQVRPVRVVPGAEPCRQSFGVLDKGLDGYVRPMLCSQPEHGDDQSRFNVGFFAKQMQDDVLDRVPAGYVHARVGVEQPVWSELALYHNYFMAGQEQ